MSCHVMSCYVCMYVNIMYVLFTIYIIDNMTSHTCGTIYIYTPTLLYIICMCIYIYIYMILHVFVKQICTLHIPLPHMSTLYIYIFISIYIYLHHINKILRYIIAYIFMKRDMQGWHTYVMMRWKQSKTISKIIMNRRYKPFLKWVVFIVLTTL